MIEFDKLMANEILNGSNTRFFNFLSQNQTLLHLFNYYGYHSGNFILRDYLPSGFTIIEQDKAYLNKNHRLLIAKEIVDSASHNIIKNLQYYFKPSKAEEKMIDFGNVIEEIEQLRISIQKTETTKELMGIEGNIREKYYDCWEKILGAEFALEKRVKNLPDNAINAMISFCNGLVYATVLSEIYHTHLEPTISFLHELGRRRYSLALNIAEIFKPLLADRMIFRLLNTKQIQSKHFRTELNFCYLEETGRKIIFKEYDERLKTTIHHRNLKRKVSYSQLIRLEVYKLVKHLVSGEEYKGFKTWW